MAFMTARDAMFILKQDVGTTAVSATTEQQPWEVMVNYLNELEQTGHKFPKVSMLTKPQTVKCISCGLTLRWYTMNDARDIRVHSDIPIGAQCQGAHMSLHEDPT